MNNPTKPQLPSLLDLLETVRSSESPTEREFALRTAYLMGGVDAMNGIANKAYEQAVAR